MTTTCTRDKENRTNRLNVFFDGREYAQLLMEAKRARMKPSSLVREKFFSSRLHYVPELNLEAWIKLAPAAANLNQIARYLNCGMRLEICEVAKILAEFRIALVCASRG